MADVKLKRECVVPGCPRTDTVVRTAIVGGEKIPCPLCPPHDAEYRGEEFRA